MSKFIDKIEAQLTGNTKLNLFNNTDITAEITLEDFTHYSSLSKAYVEEYKFITKYEQVMYIREDEVDRVRSMFIRALKAEIYEDFALIIYHLEKAMYARDMNKMKEEIRNLLKEIN